MSRRCTVCQHYQRTEIEREIVSGIPLKRLAKLFRLSRFSLMRHRDHHLPEVIVQARHAEQITHADDLAERLEALLDDAERIRTQAEKAHDYRAALRGVCDMVRINEVLLEVRGELNRSPHVDILLSNQWLRLRTVLLHALEAFPEARAAVARALSDLPSVHALPTKNEQRLPVPGREHAAGV